MNNETGKQLIKSAAAVICVAGICISAAVSTDKVADAIKATATSSSSQQGETAFGGDSIPTDDTVIDNNASGELVTDLGTDQTDAAQPDAAQPSDSSSGTSQSGSAASGSQSTTKPSANKQMSKAEIINYCNTALNKAKAAKVGYNKKMVRDVKGSTDGISPKLISLVATNKSTTMKKGSSDIKDDFPAAGYGWSSKLREQDVANATIKTNGQYYEIRLTLGKEQNPAKGEASSYGRVMSVIDAAEAGKMVPGIKSINMSYHDGYVYAKIDSKTGKLVSAEFSAAADIQAKIAIFGDVSVKDIVSTETFTNIVW